MVTSTEAFALLAKLGASAWLVRHHELVVEAARLVCRAVSRLGLAIDDEVILAGAALHDAGKIVHPGEEHAPGHEHEQAGQALLVASGVPASLARFCVTHASWGGEDRTLEDLLVALADKLWKGKRVDDLEQLAITRIARVLGRSEWEVFAELDAPFEAIAAGGSDRLARSQV